MDTSTTDYFNSESNEAPPANRFFDNVLVFIDLITYIAQVCQDKGYNIISPTIVQLGKITVEAYDKVELIDGFIDYSHGQWAEFCPNDENGNYDKKRDDERKKKEEYLEKHIIQVFNCLPVNKNYIELFAKLFNTTNETGQKIVDQSFRDQIWTFIDSFVKISLDHLHQSSQPDIQYNEETGQKSAAYRRSFKKHVNLAYHCKRWKFERKFKRRL